MRDLPTVFKGVFWDDGWEFDAPAVVYFPVKCYSPNGSNSEEIDQLVENICLLICEGATVNPKSEWNDRALQEFAWRRWSLRGFAKRKKAWHVTIRVKWSRRSDGELSFKITKRTETWGPHERKA